MGSVLIIVGGLLLLSLPYWYWQKSQFVKRSIVTVGRVVNKEGASVISFRTASGEEVVATISGWGPKNMQQDEEFKIVYSLDDPKQVELKSYLWLGIWLNAAASFVLIVFGCLQRRGIIVAGPLQQ